LPGLQSQQLDFLRFFMASELRMAPVARARELETQLRRFPRGYRRRLRKVARASSRLGELMYTFPALAFVLAAGGQTSATRARAIKLVKDGRPLPEVAEAIGLPLWMRRLPPEAFTDTLASVPVGDEFGRRIVNHVPAKPGLTAMWLRWVLFGAQACGESLALWLAKQTVYQEDDAGKIPLLPLAAFAWFSQAEESMARRLIAKPWHGNMRFGAAVEACSEWLERVVFDCCHDSGFKSGNWFKAQNVCGYRFMPLLTPDGLMEEGEKMRNCVASYIHKASSGACLIYSIQRGGQRLATMEIAPRRLGPAIVQLLAAGNAAAHNDVWKAANLWLSQQGGYPPVGRDWIAQVPLKPSRWEAVWRPYVQARPASGASLAEPSMRTLVDLRRDIRALARLA
jgi:PcfJ-like protein